MKNLKNWFTTPLSRPLNKGALAFVFIISALGFVDAGYLTVEHYMNAVPPCAIGGCEIVLTSQFSSVLGLPVSLFGALFYLFVLILLMVYLDAKKEMAFKIAAGVTALGALISFILILIQAFVIHAYCLYCMTSDILTIILFIGFVVILKKYRTSNDL